MRTCFGCLVTVSSHVENFLLVFFHTTNVVFKRKLIARLTHPTLMRNESNAAIFSLLAKSSAGPSFYHVTKIQTKMIDTFQRHSSPFFQASEGHV